MFLTSPFIDQAISRFEGNGDITSRVALRREHLGQMSDAQQFQHARCHVGEFEGASPLIDCGRLEANQSSESGAIQMFYIAKVDDDATAKKDEGPHHFFYLANGVTDQLAMTLDCRHWIAVFIFIFRKFAVEGTISCHSSAVSFSDSTDRPSMSAIAMLRQLICASRP
jgi:hypothetical protein